MAQQDTSQIKEKIIYVFRTKGPSIPVHIAKETGLSMLFASAFLSEMLAEKKLKISNMKVGNTPIYFIPGQEPQLEKFSEYLKSKEKEAYFLLKEKKFLKDTSQEPPIRVALREIRDFAIPFRKNEEVYWRYFTVDEKEFPEESKKEIKTEEKKIERLGVKKSEKENTLDIFDKSKPRTKSQKKSAKSSKKSTKSKKGEKFFNQVKEYLNKNQIEILDIISFSESNIILKIKDNGNEKVLIAYKKRITERELIDAHKKAKELGGSYSLLSLKEPTKKIESLIDSIKSLSEIKKID